ncbi:MAG: hypothetical protein KTR20_10950 [Cellvibrionaceae bacterium]|nr:hypothetical protein [Cellvibrionaceae bacterium]
MKQFIKGRKLMTAGLLSLLPALSSCQQMPSATYVPAVFLTADKDRSITLATLLEKQLGTPVKLAANAFTETSFIYLETSSIKNQHGMRLNDFTRPKPIRIQLLLQKNTCLLHQKGKSDYWVLDNTECVAELQ